MTNHLFQLAKKLAYKIPRKTPLDLRVNTGIAYEELREKDLAADRMQLLFSHLRVLEFAPNALDEPHAQIVDEVMTQLIVATIATGLALGYTESGMFFDPSVPKPCTLHEVRRSLTRLGVVMDAAGTQPAAMADELLHCLLDILDNCVGACKTYEKEKTECQAFLEQ